jgi:tetratricopeptide (TPR) repeat protein
VLTLAGPAAPARASDDAEARSREAYERGQRHYDLGEFVEAERWFREAYRIAPVPGLLFDVAQALRRQGRCRDAIAAYQTFLRLATDGDPTEVARGHVAALEVTCPAPTLAPPPSPAPAVRLPAEPAPVAVHRSLGPPIVTAGGVVAAAAGAALLVWARDRDGDWRSTDALLRDHPPADDVVAATMQRENDALRTRIDRAESVSAVALTIGSALIVGGVVWWLAQR